MTRVLCLTSWYPPHHTGGYELSCADVMTRLAERGHHVEVLTSDHRHEGVPDGDPAPVAAVHRRLRLYFRDGALWSPGLRTRLAVERDNQAALEDALASTRPDVVAVWHVGALSLGLLTTLVRRGIPLVYAVSDDWPAYASKLDAWTRLFRWAPGVRWLVERATGVPTTVPDLGRSGVFCFISEVTRGRMQRGAPWSFPNSTLVYSGIDRRLYRGPARTAPRPWRWQLLYVGRIDPRKGTRTLLEALALLPDATLVIDGRPSEPEREQLTRWVDELELGDRVRLQTSDRADLPSVYAAADVCVFPSEWTEPFGLVPLEAMASGTPVVATGVGGSAEFLVDGGNCLRYPAGDAAALADAVRRLAADPDLRDRLVAAGAVTADFFDVERLADTFEAWHQAAADGFSGELPADREPPALPVG